MTTVYTPNIRDSTHTVKLGGVDLILFESEVTEHLKQEVERCNGLLKSFRLRLVME